MGYKYSRGRREGQADPFLGFAAKSCGGEALGGGTVHIAILNKNGTGVAGAPPPSKKHLYGSGKFLYAYGTQASVNQVGLL